MNRYKTFCVSMCLAIAGPGAVTAFAADDHGAHHPATDQAKKEAAPEAGSPQGSVEVSDNMKKMQEQMAAIKAAKDPAQRTKLMDEHMRTMQTTMMAMQKNGGCTMSASQGSGSGMGMMQMMMDQMMQHQKGMEQAPGSK